VTIAAKAVEKATIIVQYIEQVKIMRIISYSEARNGLKSVLDGVENDADITIITRRDGGDAVVMSMAHYQSMAETLYLLSSPANAAHLAASIAEIAFTSHAWSDYLYWQGQDKKTLKRINLLIDAARRDPFEGIGKPEPLLGNLSGYWSRRIDDVHRLVYAVDDVDLTVIACRGHYQ
jgi:toxin YoeB